MDTLLVRLKPYDPMRGFVLRRYSYRGIRFLEERGWYRVEKEVGAHLRGVQQQARPHSPLAFDVCTEEEAREIQAKEQAEANPRCHATDMLALTPARVEDGSPGRTATTDQAEAGTRPGPGRRGRARNMPPVATSSVEAEREPGSDARDLFPGPTALVNP